MAAENGAIVINCPRNCNGFSHLLHEDKSSEQSEREGEAPSGSAGGGGDASPYN